MAFDLEPYIPYMGNKFGIVEDIYTTIRSLLIPKPKGIVDAFCGGGSFTYFMASHGYPVIANDIDKDLIELHFALYHTPQIIEMVRKEPITKKDFEYWKDSNCLFGTLVRYLWSFSNNGQTYLTSEKNEEKKIQEFLSGQAEPNTRFKHIEDITLLHSRAELEIDWRCGSFEDLEIPEGYLCYCDPPYKGTYGYKSGQFDHEKFYAWALAQPGLVLISEYGMPSQFELVDQYFKYNEGGGALKRKVATECLYANKPVNKLALF